jgi:hypothetical protein
MPPFPIEQAHDHRRERDIQTRQTCERTEQQMPGGTQQAESEQHRECVRGALENTPAKSTHQFPAKEQEEYGAEDAGIKQDCRIWECGEKVDVSVRWPR